MRGVGGRDPLFTKGPFPSQKTSNDSGIREFFLRGGDGNPCGKTVDQNPTRAPTYIPKTLLVQMPGVVASKGAHDRKPAKRRTKGESGPLFPACFFHAAGGRDRRATPCRAMTPCVDQSKRFGKGEGEREGERGTVFQNGSPLPLATTSISPIITSSFFVGVPDEQVAGILPDDGAHLRFQTCAVLRAFAQQIIRVRGKSFLDVG